VDILRGNATSDMLCMDNEDAHTGRQSDYMTQLLQQQMNYTGEDRSSKAMFQVDMARSPPSINEVYHPHRLRTSTSPKQLGRATTLLAGSYHPPSDHPLGPNSNALVETSGQRKLLLGDSDEMVSRKPMSSRLQSPTRVKSLKNDLSGKNHPLRLALRTTSEKLSLSASAVNLTKFDFGPRTVSSGAGFRLPSTALELALQQHKTEVQQPKQNSPLISATGEKRIDQKTRFTTHTGSSIQKTALRDGTGHMSLARGGSSGWR
jgi:hypothetical protein